MQFERWVEVLDALETAKEGGRDATSTLRGFGLTSATWTRASQWWARFFAENATREGGRLYARYVQLRQELRSRRAPFNAEAVQSRRG